MKDKIVRYLKSDDHYWWTVSLLPGLYAISYLYLNNYTLVNSWTQFIYLLLYMIVLPSFIVIGIHYLIKNKNARIKNTVSSSLLIIISSITLSLVIYLGWRWKALILVGIIGIIGSWLFGKHYKKGVLVLGFMTILGFLQLGFYFFADVFSKENWVKESPLIKTEFQKKPNIYLIQPDGYASKVALDNKHYNYDNTDFYKELIDQQFIINHNYRSNYSSTLTSNAVLFTGQHHFYENGNLKNELFNARQVIMGNNPVLEAFKNNGYHTTAILQHRYLLLNHPDVAYDRINISNSELSILPDYELDKDYLNDLKAAVETAPNDQPQFYFIEILEPGHITGLKAKNTTVTKERDKYVMDLNETNIKLFHMIDYITDKDPTGIIIMAADHGGFVGYNYTGESYEKSTDDIALKEAIFGALFAIKAPKDFQFYQSNIKSSISLFPTLLSYLAEKPIETTKFNNSSYQLIKNGTQRGIYRYYDEDGNPVTEKLP